MTQNQKGFTLIELMVVIAILGILLGIGVPGMSMLLAQSRVSAAATDVQLALQGARSVALSQRETYSVCAGTDQGEAACENKNNWAQGWVTYKGGKTGVVTKVHALSGVDVSTETPDFTYGPMGYLQPAIPQSIHISANGGQAERWVCVTASGKVSVSRASC